MAAAIYVEFDTTPANLAADLKTKILTQTDWAALTGAGLTTAVKATTTRGSQMVVDLADIAVTAIKQQVAVYRTHDGTTGVDKINRFLTWRTSGGATTDTVHCVVSAGKEHLYFSVEGPRAGETNAVVAASGSSKQSLFIGDITPYFGGDTIPAVCLVAATSSTVAPVDEFAYVSRNAADTTSWVPCYLCTVSPITLGASGAKQPTVPATADSNKYLWPWIVVESSAGLRGRLTSAFHGGYSSPLISSENGLSPGSKITYSSQNYLAVVPTMRRESSSASAYTGWFRTSTTSTIQTDHPLVMVPSP